MKYMKRFHKLTSFVLVILLLISGFSTTVNAKNISTEKEEVVYAMLDEKGNVTGVYVVNIFESGNITDYGEYSSVRNLTTTDDIKVDGNEISIASDADKIYYQGNMITTDIPWNIAIHYYLDGKEYEASEIAGKDGKLKITIEINQNLNCNNSFWEGYALQATMALDAEKCKNIEAEGATIANVGSKKQLSYIIMPGKGANLEITADVTDFEMDAISINGTKLNLNFEMDSEELIDKIKEIQDAVNSLNEGATKLNNASGKLENGSEDIYNGTLDLNTGALSLKNGLNELNEGIETIQDALNALNANSSTLTNGSSEVLTALKTIQISLERVKIDAEKLLELSQASTEIKNGIDTLVMGLNTMDDSISNYYSALSEAGISDINAFVEQHSQAIKELGITDTQRSLYNAYMISGVDGVQRKIVELVTLGDTEAINLYKQYTTSGDVNVVMTYLTNVGKLISIETLLKADISYIQGSNNMISGIYSQLDSESGELMKGALLLQSNYNKFDESIQSLVVSLGSLTNNMVSLKTGINTLVDNYEGLDVGMKEYTNGVAKIVEGYTKVYDGSINASRGVADLYDGTTKLVDGTLSLYNGTGEMKEGIEELNDGTEEFYGEIENIDSEVPDMIDDTIAELVGKNVKTVSFVSEENVNIESVLFVIKTPVIEKQSVSVEIEEDEVKVTWWNKFLRLFRFD